MRLHLHCHPTDPSPWGPFSMCPHCFLPSCVVYSSLTCDLLHYCISDVLLCIADPKIKLSPELSRAGWIEGCNQYLVMSLAWKHVLPQCWTWHCMTSHDFLFWYVASWMVTGISPSCSAMYNLRNLTSPDWGLVARLNIPFRSLCWLFLFLYFAISPQTSAVAKMCAKLSVAIYLPVCSGSHSKTQVFVCWFFGCTASKACAR